MRLRLSLLSFLLYAPMGAMHPLFTLRLKELGFSPSEIALACTTQAFGALGALIVGQIADRWISADRCLAVCSLLSGGVLLVLAECENPSTVFLASLGFWLLMSPTLTLGTSINFAHLASPEREFGRIRLWGTVGWMAQGWLVGYWFANPLWLGQLSIWLGGSRIESELADAFRIGGVMAFILGLYALTLPRTPPSKHFESRLAPLAAIRLLSRRSFAVFFICFFGFCMTFPFWTQNAPLFLAHLGISRAALAPILTICQSTELVGLGLLPFFVARWGLRRTMLVGLSAWALALTVFTLGQPLWLVVASLSLHGVAICCFLITGQIFVNSQASGDIRASVQALIAFTMGLGMLAGHLLAGWVREQADERFGPTFAVAAALAASLVVLFLVGFNHGETTKDSVPLPTVPDEERRQDSADQTVHPPH